MYSILKSQKRSIVHKKNLTVTSSVFITNNHVLFTFSDNSCIVYSLNLSEPQSEKILFEGITNSIVTDSKRLCEGICVMICKSLSCVYLLEYTENTIEHTFKIEFKQIIRSAFAEMIFNQSQNGLLNTISCQIRLHAFNNKCFIIQNFVYQDRKIFLDCYKYRQISTAANKNQINFGNYGKQIQNIVHHWQLFTLQVDIQINGHYVLQPINYNTGQLALYKQTQISDSDWLLRILSPFSEHQSNTINLNPQNPQSLSKQVKINLPQQKFNEETTIIQICEYLDGLYMVIVSSKTTGKLAAYTISGINQNSVGNIPQNFFSFQTIPESKSTFLLDNFIKVLYVSPKDQICYILTHKHQLSDGQLYFNGLVIVNLKNGKAIQKGYCNLRNVDFSPNYRYILDVPYQYDKICVDKTIYHIRLLFSKSSLYMLLIENVPHLHNMSQRFKNVMIQML